MKKNKTNWKTPKKRTSKIWTNGKLENEKKTKKTLHNSGTPIILKGPELFLKNSTQ